VRRPWRLARRRLIAKAGLYLVHCGAWQDRRSGQGLQVYGLSFSRDLFERAACRTRCWRSYETQPWPSGWSPGRPAHGSSHRCARARRAPRRLSEMSLTSSRGPSAILVGAAGAPGRSASPSRGACPGAESTRRGRALYRLAVGSAHFETVRDGHTGPPANFSGSPSDDARLIAIRSAGTVDQPAAREEANINHAAVTSSRPSGVRRWVTPTASGL